MLTLDTPVKFLAADGSAPIRGTKWKLPKDGQPGEWMRQYKAKPRFCEIGWHYTTLRHWREWGSTRCFLIEPVGINYPVGHDKLNSTKGVAQGARLLRELNAWQTLPTHLFVKTLKLAARKHNVKLPKNFIRDKHYQGFEGKLKLQALGLPSVDAVPTNLGPQFYFMRNNINYLLHSWQVSFNINKEMLKHLNAGEPPNA